MLSKDGKVNLTIKSNRTYSKKPLSRMSYLLKQTQLKGKTNSNVRKLVKHAPSSTPRTPNSHQSDIEDIDDEFQVLKFADRLNLSSLTKSLQEVADNKEKDAESAPKKLSYQEHFEMLVTDRRSTSLEQREISLDRIAQTLVNKYSPELYSHGDLETLNKAMTTARSVHEGISAARDLVIMALLDLDDSTELLQSSSIPYLKRRFSENEEDETEDSKSLKAAFISAYALLLFFINVGSSGFGLDDEIESLTDLLSGAGSGEEDSILVSSLMFAIGLLTSVTGNRNTVIEDIAPIVVEFLKDDDSDIRQTAGKLIALLYEQYEFDPQALDETNPEAKFEIPTLENQYVLSELDYLIGPAGNTELKNNKSSVKSLLRKAYLLIESRITPQSDERRTQEEEEEILLDSGHVSHIKLARNKYLPVDTWAQLILSTLLRWLYGEGLLTQIANNPTVIDGFSEAAVVPTEGMSNKTLKAAAEFGNEDSDDDVERKKKEHKENSIKKARDDKLLAKQRQTFGEDDE